MPDIVIELPDGDIAPLLEHLDSAVFVNLRPGVDAGQVPPSSPLANLLGNRGPTVPLATWTPGEIGLQHTAGQRVARFLAEHDLPVPDDWYLVTDHPKRGLVLRTYQTPPAETLRWLVRAATVTCPLDVVGPWHATVRTR
ncbi:MAG: hypothetical protein ABWZ76_02635 [Acidimicrobiales bacterium]